MGNATPLCDGAPDREGIIRTAKEDGDLCVWEKIKCYPHHDPDGKLRSRDLFTYALVLCEANEDLDRLETLFEVAWKIQDRDPISVTYGNFRWQWRDPQVNDPNAVAFCMRGLTSSLLLGFSDHLDRFDLEKQGVICKRLLPILDLSQKACRIRWVREMYTNIALMNAMDLILLGIALPRSDVAEEGYDRLDRFCIYTWDWGVHEHCSPTYTGIDLCCLGMIERFCGTPEARDLDEACAARAQKQARALQKLLWTDVALNRLSSSQRIGGAHSRKLGTYRPQREIADLDTIMWLVGWLPGPAYPPQAMDVIYPLLAVEEQDDEFRGFLDGLKKKSDRFPRLVRQGWGHAAYKVDPSQVEVTISRMGTSRTHYLCRDVTLSTANAAYDYPDSEDLPLMVDFPSSWRCYFIPDPGTHRNPLKIAYNYAHNPPLLWAAAQRKGDALGLVLYPYKKEDDSPLESHFVMPWSKDGEVWIGNRCVDMTEQGVVDLEPGDALVYREGTAAVGVRVVWTQTLKNRRAPVRFIYQEADRKRGGMRLTVLHRSGREWWRNNFLNFLLKILGKLTSNLGTYSSAVPKEEPCTNAGAAFWVRIGSGLKTEKEFRAWREAFAKAKAKEPQVVDALLEDGDEKVKAIDRLCVEVEGAEGTVKVKEAGTTKPVEGIATRRWLFVPTIKPAASLAVLELDGEEVGRPLLKDIEPIVSYEAELCRKPLVEVPPPPPAPDESSIERSWLDARSGRVWYPMQIREAHISGGYIWLPSSHRDPEASSRKGELYGSDVGSVTWRLNIRRCGTYYMWAHVRDESFRTGPWGPRKSRASFIVRIFRDAENPLYLGTWFPREKSVLCQEALTPIVLMETGQEEPPPLSGAPFELPEGEVKLQIWGRMDEIGITCLLITPDPKPGVHISLSLKQFLEDVQMRNK